MLARSQTALLADFDNLRPTLDSLRTREGELIPTFQSLIQLGKSVRRAAPGDYLNIAGTVQFLLNAPAAHPQPGGGRAPRCRAARRGAQPAHRGCPMRRNMVLAQLVGVRGDLRARHRLCRCSGCSRCASPAAPFDVTVQLHTAGGIFDGAEVAYRGVQVGKVSSVALHTDGR